MRGPHPWNTVITKSFYTSGKLSIWHAVGTHRRLDGKDHNHSQNKDIMKYRGACEETASFLCPFKLHKYFFKGYSNL